MGLLHPRNHSRCQNLYRPVMSNQARPSSTLSQIFIKSGTRNYSFGKHVSFVRILYFFRCQGRFGYPNDTRGIFFAFLWYHPLLSFSFQLVGKSVYLPVGLCTTPLRADGVPCLFPRARTSLCVALFRWRPCLFPRARIKPACFLSRGQVFAHLDSVRMESPACFLV